METTATMDDPTDTERACTFQQHWKEMRQLASDVNELKDVYKTTAEIVAGLNAAMIHIERDLVQGLKDLNESLKVWLGLGKSLVDVGRAGIRLGKMVVAGFLLVILALVSRVLDVEVKFPGGTVRNRAEQHAPPATVAPPPPSAAPTTDYVNQKYEPFGTSLPTSIPANPAR